MDKNNQKMLFQLIPVMLAFFAMGFVDLVGIATNYVKQDFNLSDTVANLFPSMVFFWFLVCSIPTGMLMNKIGRRRTVILSLFVTMLALAIPLIGYNFTMMMISFSFLGIGNAMMQVSLNPLLSNIVSGSKLSSSLTFGQFVKAIASFTAPIIAGWGALHYGNWRLLFPICLAEAIIAAIALAGDKIKEEEMSGKTTSFTESFALLKDKMILFCFIGIMCHVGIDVGTNVSAPKLLMDKLGITLAEAGYATSIYFLFRTLGSLGGTFVLAKFPVNKVFLASITLMAAAMAGLLIFDSLIPLYVCIAMIGLGNANVFPVIFAQALLHFPKKKNEVSGLMIMGLFGGTVFPLLMGLASDALASQSGAVAVMSAGVVYLLLLTNKIHNYNTSY